jgi:RNase P subunit RPR2
MTADDPRWTTERLRTTLELLRGNSRASCLFCGGDLRFVGRTDNPPVEELVRPSTDQTPPPFAVVVAKCKTCGFVHQYAASELESHGY